MNTFLTVTLVENNESNDTQLRNMAATLAKMANNYVLLLDGGNLYWRRYEPADRPRTEWSKSTDTYSGMSFSLRGGRLDISVSDLSMQKKLKGIRMAVDAFMMMHELKGSVAYGYAFQKVSA